MANDQTSMTKTWLAHTKCLQHFVIVIIHHHTDTHDSLAKLDAIFGNDITISCHHCGVLSQFCRLLPVTIQSTSQKTVGMAYRVVVVIIEQQEDPQPQPDITINNNNYYNHDSRYHYLFATRSPTCVVGKTTTVRSLSSHFSGRDPQSTCLYVVAVQQGRQLHFISNGYWIHEWLWNMNQSQKYAILC